MANNLDNQLKQLYEKILSQPRLKTNRTDFAGKSIFGYQMRFDMADGFPLTTLRKIHVKSLIHELLWFLSSYDDKYKKFGNTNIKYLLDNDITFWTDWCYNNYKKVKLDKFLVESPKNPDKKFKCLTMKDFEKRIKEDDNYALKWGDLGPIYGKQWIDWGGLYELTEKTNKYKETHADTVLVDNLGIEKVYIKGINQIDNVINQLIDEPDSRRMIINAWNVSDLDDMMLPPCHLMFQFYTDVLSMQDRIDNCEKNMSDEDVKEYMSKNNIEDWDEIKRNPVKQIKILDHFNIPERKLSMQLYIRSQDVYLGQPFNIASYSLLLHMIGKVVNMIPFEFILTMGDAHLYENSFKAVEELLKREPRDLPILKINNDIEDIYKFRIEDFEILNYEPHNNIKVEVAV